MSRLLFVISVIVLVIIGLVSVGLLLWRRSGTEGTTAITNTGTPSTVSTQPGVSSTSGGGSTVVPPPLPPPRPAEAITLENFVRSFVERHGSYSTDAPFENLRRTFGDMTDRFRKSEERRIKPTVGVTTFYGVTVRAQSVKILEESPERVRVSVVTLWEEERGAADPQLSRKTAELVLLAEGGVWKVDRVSWK